jgi:CDP-glucose 4,6-dehydratase
LDPVSGGIFQDAKVADFLAHDIRQDIRDAASLAVAFENVRPEVVIHLAAQPLVLNSYENPRDTYETNVTGTLNVLQAVEATPSVQATLIVTTDKVYRQSPGEARAFVESDSLGAADPYSTSKAMADLLTQAWIANHPNAKIAIARAGNVVGGGDVSENRLLPDLVKAFQSGQLGVVRNPDSVRPWQHVLDGIAGYVKLVQALLSGSVFSGPFNFGPAPEYPLRVKEVADIASSVWGNNSGWIPEKRKYPKESQHLLLDSSKSKLLLGWEEKLTPLEAIQWSLDWSKRKHLGESARFLLMEQLELFRKL